MLEVRAANLLFAFRDQDDVDRKPRPRRQVRLDGLYMKEQLAFVIH